MGLFTKRRGEPEDVFGPKDTAYNFRTGEMATVLSVEGPYLRVEAGDGCRVLLWEKPDAMLVVQCGACHSPIGWHRESGSWWALDVESNTCAHEPSFTCSSCGCHNYDDVSSDWGAAYECLTCGEVETL